MPGLGSEAGGWINVGAQRVQGVNYITNAVGANYEFNQHLIVGVCYEYQLTTRTMILNNIINVQAILGY